MCSNRNSRCRSWKRTPSCWTVKQAARLRAWSSRARRVRLRPPSRCNHSDVPPSPGRWCLGVDRQAAVGQRVSVGSAATPTCIALNDSRTGESRKVSPPRSSSSATRCQLRPPARTAAPTRATASATPPVAPDLVGFSRQRRTPVSLPATRGPPGDSTSTCSDRAGHPERPGRGWCTAPGRAAPGAERVRAAADHASSTTSSTVGRPAPAAARPPLGGRPRCRTDSAQPGQQAGLQPDQVPLLPRPSPRTRHRGNAADHRIAGGRGRQHRLADPALPVQPRRRPGQPTASAPEHRRPQAASSCRGLRTPAAARGPRAACPARARGQGHHLTAAAAAPARGPGSGGGAACHGATQSASGMPGRSDPPGPPRPPAARPGPGSCAHCTAPAAAPAPTGMSGPAPAQPDAVLDQGRQLLLHDESGRQEGG